jgi:hypothetical protein
MRTASSSRGAELCLLLRKAELLRQGREVIQEASAGDVFDLSYFIFPEIGSVVELLYLDAAQLPQPEAVIGASATAV